MAAREGLRVAVIGASGYVGGELLRLLAGHPEVGTVRAFSASGAGRPAAEVHPALVHLPEQRFESPDPAGAATWAEVVFLALPHGRSQLILRELSAAPLVIDTAADFRIRDRALSEAAYGDHADFSAVAEFRYGLADVVGSELAGARRIAVPGCFATAALLGLRPFAGPGALAAPPVAVAATGSSGSGAEPKAATHHPRRAHNFFAYSVTGHRHEAEIAERLRAWSGAPGAHCTLLTHSAPLVRGIHVCLHLRPSTPIADPLARSPAGYRGRPFVRARPAARGRRGRRDQLRPPACRRPGRRPGGHRAGRHRQPGQGRRRPGGAVRRTSPSGSTRTRGSTSRGSSRADGDRRDGAPGLRAAAVRPLRGSGSMLDDAAGRAMLDLYGGHAVALTGHCHPQVVAAVGSRPSSCCSTPTRSHSTSATASSGCSRRWRRLRSSRLPGQLRRGGQRERPPARAPDHRPAQGRDLRRRIPRPHARDARRLGDRQVPRARATARAGRRWSRRHRHRVRRSAGAVRGGRGRWPRCSSSRCRAWPAPATLRRTSCGRRGRPAMPSARC